MRRMDISDSVNDYFNAHLSAVSRIELASVSELAQEIIDALHKNRTVFLAGNGGSAAAASHFAADLSMGIRTAEGIRLRVHCLAEGLSTLTAYANDFGYENIFVEQLRSHMSSRDIFIALSGSGDSENVVRAALYAKSLGATVVAITGFNGGRLKSIADLALHTPVNCMYIAEDIQTLVNHAIMNAVRNYLELTSLKND